ncbi:SDR family oxidoreductase [Candidatus Roizmanbacteria bacterium]|nr:SDR family oxidoreductase [Candidatus Roizmanbacteria bacterium]
MKIVITGGAGFIGSHLCDNLIKKKHEVICVDNFLTGRQLNIQHLLDNPRFRLIKHDVIYPLTLSSKIDAIYHLASPASPNHHSRLSYHAHPMETMLANTQGTLLLLKFAKKHRAKFLFASSSEVYGNPYEHPQKEKYNGNVSTTGPRSVYDESKRFGETITSYFVRNESIDSRIARIFNTYGPRMQKEDMRMIVRFITQALNGDPMTIYGDGKQTRSLCNVDDMVEGLARLMFYPKTKGEVVNLGATEEHTVLDYAHLIKKLTNSQSQIIFSEPLPQDDPKKRKPDINKAKKLLNWEPKISLEDGLKKTIDYINSNI